ncbi:MAG: transglutaminase family protein, partial [Planctomycetaceae bacterium]|nr:transglutaminase family protein [Planctomycetaceae bacterium]
DNVSSTAPSTSETWDAIYLQGSKVGWVHTLAKPDPDNAGMQITETEFVMSIERFGQKTEQRVKSTSWETTDGQLIFFKTEAFQGPNPVRTQGTALNGQLELVTMRDGREEKSSIVMEPDCRGLHGIEQSLKAKPMQAGEQRTIQALMPIVNRVARCDLTAKSVEKITLPAGEHNLLRVQLRQTIPGAPPMDATLWCDASGDVLKQRVDALGQETVRTTQELAQRVETGKSFDLGTHSSVLTNRPPRDLHAARRAVYHVVVKDGQATELFPSGPAQQVKLLAGATAEIVVRAVRPQPTVPGPAVGNDAPINADRQPSSMIQSDDPRVMALAKSIEADDAQPWQVATQLEQLVHRQIKHKNLSQTFVSAAETLASGEGDCTEHAVLLAALLRARSLPARTVAGLVYVDALPGFAFHMWTEVYIGSEWIGLDGTLGRGGLGAGHLKVSHTSLADSGAIVELLPVVQLLGKLAIKIESVD